MGTSQQPPGIKVRVGPDFDQAAQFGGWALSSGQAGRFSFVELYNSGNQQRTLNLYGLSMGVGASGVTAQCGPVQLQLGSQQNFTGPIIPGQMPSETGQVFFGSKVLLPLLPTNLAFTFRGRQDMDLYFDYPISILPPGWGFMCLLGVADVDLTASFLWTETPWPLDSPPVMIGGVNAPPPKE